MKKFVIAGIGTGVGKTLCSAILVEALKADYWKPVQAGDLENSDTISVKNLISNPVSVFYPETYQLKTPASPHYAARLDGIEIDPENLKIPETKNNLIIELAGGLMVPLNEQYLNIDLLKKWNLPVILISQNYLGSINHTLLSIEVLKNKNIPIHGIIFNGDANPATEELILNYSHIYCLGRIPALDEVDQKSVFECAQNLKTTLKISS